MDSPDLDSHPSPPSTTSTRGDIALDFRSWSPPDPAAPQNPRLPPPSNEDPLDPIFTDDTLLALVKALPAAATDNSDDKLRRKAAAMHLLRSLDAQQPVEAALANQAVLFHYAALAALRRAALPDQPANISHREIASAGRATALFCRLLHELAWKQASVQDAMSAEQAALAPVG
jgi:hypothetical protein